MTGSSHTRFAWDIGRLLGPVSTVQPGDLIGLEHEYVVRSSGQVIDFRELIQFLPVPGRRLDPGDRNAYRLPCGLALTADESEAEIATPPIAVLPGFAVEVVAWAQHGRAQLEHTLPPGYELEGYSTHLSVAMPGLDGDEVAHLYAQTFAPALAMLLERPQSLGVYVRPRPGRLELCGEFVEGPRLAAVAAFVAGSGRAIALALQGRGQLPPPLAVDTLPSIERYGLRVTRRATGLDLYSEGREALLPLAAGGKIRAQDYLEGAVRAAKAALLGRASPGDFAVLERIVAADLPLGIEAHEVESLAPRASPPTHSALGDVLRLWRRPGFTVEAKTATWDFTVFQLNDGFPRTLLSVPRELLAPFVAALDEGRLDVALLATMGSVQTFPLLETSAQTADVGVFSAMPDPVLLLPAEREPDSGVAKTWRAGRAGKAVTPPIGPRPKSTGRPWKLVIPLRPQRVVPPTLGAPPPPPIEAPLPPDQPPPPRFTETGPPPHEMVPGPPLPPPPGSASPANSGGIPWLVVATVAVIGALGVVIAGAISLHSNDSDPPQTLATPVTLTATPTLAATATPSAAATPSPTPKVAAAVASPSPAAATITPLAATVVPTSTSTVKPTETVAVSPTAFATETPRPTPTQTATRTSTPRPTATATVTPLIIVLPPPTAKPACTPSAGTVCQ